MLRCCVEKCYMNQNVFRIVFATHILLGIVYNNSTEIKIRNRYKHDTVLLQIKDFYSIRVEIPTSVSGE